MTTRVTAVRGGEPMHEFLKYEPARMPFFGDAITRKPALVLAEVVGHSRNKVFRPGNTGLGGRDRIERIACTSHEWCSLTLSAGDTRFSSRRPHSREGQPGR